MKKQDIRLKLVRIREYLSGLNIPSARNGQEVVFEINGQRFRSKSLYDVKKIVKREGYC
jgi:hypothetical protein